MSLVVLIIGTILAMLLRTRLSVERPGAFQQSAEMLLTNPMGFGIKDLLEENVAHGAEKYIPFIGSISIFVLLSNLLSVFPAFSSPTGIADCAASLRLSRLSLFQLAGHSSPRRGPLSYDFCRFTPDP